MNRKALSAQQLERINLVTADRAERVSFRIHELARIVGDVAREARKTARRCAHCYYMQGHRLAGQAFTEWTCRLCGQVDTCQNTAHPVVCETCADAYGLCVDCGADVDLKHRSRRDNKPRKARK
jgi:hypothetical protein